MHNIVAAHKRIERAMWCLAKVAEQAAEGIAVLALNGTILFVNAAWAAMHGYNTKNELIGKHVGLFHTKEQMKTDLIPFINEAKRRGQLAGPLEHVRKDGSPLLTQTKMTTVTDETGKAIALVAFTSDRTDKRQAQHELQKYCSQLEKQIAELKTTNQKLQKRITEHVHDEEELLESIIDADGPTGPIEPFNPQELKALGELARRLT